MAQIQKGSTYLARSHRHCASLWCHGDHQSKGREAGKEGGTACRKASARWHGGRSRESGNEGAPAGGRDDSDCAVSVLVTGVSEVRNGCRSYERIRMNARDNI